MSSELKGSKIPQIGEYLRNIGKLVAIEEVVPPPPKIETDYIFEEVEARCELKLNGEVLKHISTLNDFYGLETSVETAIKEMKEYAENRNINKDSDVEVVVIKRVYQIRKRALNRENFWSDEYVDFEAIEHRADRDLPEPIETIVWSSRELQ